MQGQKHVSTRTNLHMMYGYSASHACQLPLPCHLTPAHRSAIILNYHCRTAKGGLQAVGIEYCFHKRMQGPLHKDACYGSRYMQVQQIRCSSKEATRVPFGRLIAEEELSIVAWLPANGLHQLQGEVNHKACTSLKVVNSVLGQQW